MVVEKKPLPSQERQTISYNFIPDGKSQFEQLFLLSPDGILIARGDGQIEMANPRVCFILDAQESSQIVGKNILSFIPKELHETALGLTDMVLNNSMQISMAEMEFVSVQQSRIPVEVSLAPFLSNQYRGFQIIMRDITERRQTEDYILKANFELNLAYKETLDGWGRALELRDDETEGHTRRVTEATVRLAMIIGVSVEDILHIRRGALLHDIGKIGIPDAILLKPGPLTDEEWAIMKMHPTFAYQLLSPISYLKPALDIPLYHHERWDGSGYPEGLKGKDIPLAARIFALIDVWDALLSNRPYRKAWQREKVMEYIQSQAGKHFDPEIVPVFLKNF